MILDFPKETELYKEFNKICTPDDFFKLDLAKPGASYTFVDCDLNRLIQKVIISPWANDDYVEEVKYLLKEAGLNSIKACKSCFHGEKEGGKLLDLY